MSPYSCDTIAVVVVVSTRIIVRTIIAVTRSILVRFVLIVIIAIVLLISKECLVF